MKLWRRERGISQEALAEKAELHRTYVSDVERGARNLSLESITKLARALEISVAALFSKANQPAGCEHLSDHEEAELVEILLIEDNSGDVELTLQAFEQARFANRVHIIDNGAEAVDFLFCRGKYAQRQPTECPQLILLDLNLPKLNGIDVLRTIKADKRTASIPVVILTGSDRESDIAQCRQLGADNYIVKPVDFRRLSEATPSLSFDWALIKPVKPKPEN